MARLIEIAHPVWPPISQADYADPAELIVTRFPANGTGTFIDNINRWRGQLGLSPIDDASTVPLKDIKVSDTIRFTTPEGTTEYRVLSTKIVGPKDTYVLDAKNADTMTLITCYPFYYIGPAPKRFIVEAAKN